MSQKPEQTTEMHPTVFHNTLSMFVGQAFADYMLRKPTKHMLANAMSGLNCISIDDPNDSTKSIGTYEHPEYHNVMGELLRRWKITS